MTGGNGKVAKTMRREGIVADAPALRAVAAQLEQELETLACAFDNWWYAGPADSKASDLREGARLHQQIASRLDLLATIRGALTAGMGGSAAPQSAGAA
jgi:hypothetical protein